jgi:hypothetical protein
MADCKPDPHSTELFSTFSNADHGGCKDTGHSTGGYILKIGIGAVSWSSKLQGVIALSTTEAEYIAAVEAGKEIKWMCKLLLEMGVPAGASSVLRIGVATRQQTRMMSLNITYLEETGAVGSYGLAACI